MAIKRGDLTRHVVVPLTGSALISQVAASLVAAGKEHIRQVIVPLPLLVIASASRFFRRVRDHRIAEAKRLHGLSEAAPVISEVKMSQMIAEARADTCRTILVWLATAVEKARSDLNSTRTGSRPSDCRAGGGLGSLVKRGGDQRQKQDRKPKETN